jgi:hypothetical protein
MHERCLKNPHFRIEVLGYANELENDSNDIPHAACAAPATTSNDEEADLASSNRVSNSRRPTKKRRSHIKGQEGQDLVKGGEKIDQRYIIRRQQKSKTGGVESSPPAQEIPTSLSPNLEPGHISTNEGPYASINAAEASVPGDGMLSGDFTYISQMFFDQQFLDRDRVISYDDGMFVADMDWLGNGS